MVKKCVVTSEAAERGGQRKSEKRTQFVASRAHGLTYLRPRLRKLFWIPAFAGMTNHENCANAEQ